MILLFDAANTLIHKPQLAVKFVETLAKHGYWVDIKTFRYHHKLLSEAIIFPDKTSRDFYHHFNGELLYTLGIVPNEELLEEIFKACSYLPWEPFDDFEFIADWTGQIGILSNFHKGLTDLLGGFFPGRFNELIISEASEFRKPDLNFYLSAIEKFNVPPSDILYVGDSPKLDLEPALQAGMNAWLIDRDNFYPACKRRIVSLNHVPNLVNG